MNHVYNVGTQKIFSTLSISALKQFSLPTEHVHFDTTSVNVYGEYQNNTSDDSPFKMAQGYSKDHRPDLKQFVLSLLCVGGNADEAFIYIADSAMVTDENITLANRFITRLPATYKACDHAIALLIYIYSMIIFIENNCSFFVTVGAECPFKTKKQHHKCRSMCHQTLNTHVSSVALLLLLDPNCVGTRLIVFSPPLSLVYLTVVAHFIPPEVNTTSTPATHLAIIRHNFRPWPTS